MTPLELDQIAAELREARPAPERDFAAELDAWAAAGFPRRREAGDAAARPARRPRGERLGLRRRLLPALAFGATALVVIGVAVSQTGNGDISDEESAQLSGEDGVALEEQSVPQSPDSTSGATGRRLESTIAPTPPPGIPGSDLKPGRERVQEQSASLTISTDGDELADVADEVVDVSDRYNGFVVSSSVSSGEEQRGRASFDLRIPTQNLQAALADLSDLGHVRSRNEGTLDITAPYLTAGERLEDARAEVDSLLERLESAESAEEIAALRVQLRVARAEQAAARAQLASLKQRASYSTVTVSLIAEGDGPGWSLGEAAEDAVDVLESIGGALLVALAVIVPLSLLGAGLWFGSAGLRRRRRESVLDD